MNGSREAVWRVARVHLERTGNARIEFRSGERHFRPPRLKKSVGLNGVCRHPRGMLPSLRNTLPSFMESISGRGAYVRSWLVGSVATRILRGLLCFSGMWRLLEREEVCENIFLGETEWARDGKLLRSVRIFVHLSWGIYIYIGMK